MPKKNEKKISLPASELLLAARSFLKLRGSKDAPRDPPIVRHELDIGVTKPEREEEKQSDGLWVTQRRGGNMLVHRQQAWFAFCAAKTRGRGGEKEEEGGGTHRNSVSGLMEQQEWGEDPPKLDCILSFSSTFFRE